MTEKQRTATLSKGRAGWGRGPDAHLLERTGRIGTRRGGGRAGRGSPDRPPGRQVSLWGAELPVAAPVVK